MSGQNAPLGADSLEPQPQLTDVGDKASLGGALMRLRSICVQI